MIENNADYLKAKEELQELEDWLGRLDRDFQLPEKGLTKAGIRKMIARLHEELAEFEGAVEIQTARP